MSPAETRDIEGWLAELSVIVARRPGDDFSEELRLTAYASRLRDYPADVVREALLSRTWKFWPTWEELKIACEALVAPRRLMIAALVHGSTPDHRRDVSAEEKQRAQKVAAEYLAMCAEQDKKAHERKRVPHWSENAAPDDPHWAALRKARAENALIINSAPEPF
jgi:hypothetical protein